MKREPMGHEREQNGWLGTTLRRSASAASDGCLDAETLAAWADGGLSAKAAAAVELHASSCSRCIAVLAAMERTAPAPSATHAWTPARLFRWAAPLAAAATAVAIWVLVPDRMMTPVQPAPAHDLAVPAPAMPERGISEPGIAERVTPEPGTQNQNPEPSTQNLEPKVQVQPAPSARLKQPAVEEQPQFRDELRRERPAPQALGAAGTAAPEAAAPAAPPAFAPEASPAPPPAAPAPQAAAAPSTVARSAAAAPAAAADSRAETAAVAQERSNFTSRIVGTGESIAPSNALMRWRVVQPVSVERSRDGGKTWTKTILPAPNVVSVRAVDADRAVATTSDKTEFYTANAGRSWTRVQENSAAPF
jgi:hypothetical protein